MERGATQGMMVTLVVAIVVASVVAAGVSYLMTPRAAARTPQTVEVYMIAGDFGADTFLPGSLTAYRGDTLRIHITNTEDEDHDFTIAEFGVDTEIRPGVGNVTNVPDFVVSQVGTFAYRCNYHQPEMTGWLTVIG